MSEPTCQALCYSGADFLSNVKTYLPALCYSGVIIYVPGTVLQGCRLLKKCQKQPAGHCVTVVKALLAMSESTCQALCYSVADCLSGVGTYLPALCYSDADCLSSVRVYLLGTVLQ